jgi:trans-aconitate 2-methyltransferase
VTDWNPSLYTQFEQERTRPAADLLRRVALDEPREVVDLGCGPGNSTELLVRRFPQARVVGTDTSQAMLERARERLPGTVFEQSDIATWKPPAPVDLVYANAALQWVPDHEALLPRLLGAVAPGGALAVQMPDNLDEPSHALMRETAAQAPFAAHVGDAETVRARILRAADYYDLLSGAAAVDIWRTTYYHPMRDAGAIVQWLRATGLKAFLDRLPPGLQPAFLAAYEARIDTAYPTRADGLKLLAFPRLFIVATTRR